MRQQNPSPKSQCLCPHPELDVGSFPLVWVSCTAFLQRLKGRGDVVNQDGHFPVHRLETDSERLGNCDTFSHANSQIVDKLNIVTQWSFHRLSSRSRCGQESLRSDDMCFIPLSWEGTLHLVSAEQSIGSIRWE